MRRMERSRCTEPPTAASRELRELRREWDVEEGTAMVVAAERELRQAELEGFSSQLASESSEIELVGSALALCGSDRHVRGKVGTLSDASARVNQRAQEKLIGSARLEPH